MTLEEVRNCKVALTHAGEFHSDDVFGTAFLKIINPDIVIKRVNEVPQDFKGLVFDIGLGEFDHHMLGNEVRDNGIPYASFGKLWKAFAIELYGEFVYQKIDKNFIEHLDLSDNTGIKDSLATAISVFNPLEKRKNSDNEFNEAVIFAKKILEKMIAKEQRNEQESLIVQKYYENSKDKRIIVLDKHYHYRDYLPKTEALYVIFPSERGGYGATAIPKSSDTVELKHPFPEDWVKNKPKFITFIHSSRFHITTKTLEDAIYACNEAIKKDN